MIICLKTRKAFRSVSYVIFGFAVLWVISMYYMAFWRRPASISKADIVSDDVEVVRRSINELMDEIRSAEFVLKQQMEKNRQLLNKIHKSLDWTKSPNQDKRLDIYSNYRIAVLVISCNRPDAVSNLLDKLLKYRPSSEQFPIVVSLDCGHSLTESVVQSYFTKTKNLKYIKHPDQSPIHVPAKMKKFIGYYKLARHYRWALNQTFQDNDNVIIVEDDLDISPDFFEYFLVGNRLLDMDPTLWCVSGWNDHGKSDYIDSSKPELLHRTDFFGGLGWLLQKHIWLELESTWPETFWDDWMRHPDRRKGRACIRPEIPRTSMSLFGKIGVSKGLYFDKHLKHIKLNDQYVNFTNLDLSYLLKDNYDKSFFAQVYKTPLITLQELDSAYEKGLIPETARIAYDSQRSFVALAKNLKIMDDAKAGVPRMAYYGVVSIYYKKTRVFLSPQTGWKKYDETWT